MLIRRMPNNARIFLIAFFGKFLFRFSDIDVKVLRKTL